MATTTEAVAVLKPQQRRKGLFLLLGCLAVLVIGAGYWWWQGRQGQVNYMSMPVRQGSIVNTVRATGTIEAVKSVGLNFKTSGFIKEIYVKPGDQVKKGQLLACLDTADLEAQVVQARASLKAAEAKLRLLEAGALETDIAQAEANVAQAQVAYDSAEEALKRDQALFEIGALAQVDFNNSLVNRDTAAARLRQAQAALEALKSGNRPEDIAAAEAQVETAQAQLTLAQNDLDSARLRAPFDGVIAAVRGETGQRTSGGGSESSDSTAGLITLITTGLQLRAQVNEADISQVKVGQKATFTVNAFPERTFNGEVAWISPEATTVSNVQLYDVVVSLTDPGSLLKAGMSASVNIIVSQRDNVITVPRAAVNFAASYRATRTDNATDRTASSGGNANGIKTTDSRQAGREMLSPDDGRRGELSEELKAKLEDLRGKLERGEITREQFQEEMKKNMPEEFQLKDEPGQAAGSGNRAVVLVMEKGQPVVRHIVTGLSDESNIEVKSGLKVGEEVIIGASTPGKSAESSSSSSPSSMRGVNPPLQPTIRMRGM
ncbi:MAG: efflux RND transporter periplasmic adaptor subunit [Bacillota bacterium]|nr:efflux RND transporter periplasmic adaptor subunit [Bacillota bacterium]